MSKKDAPVIDSIDGFTTDQSIGSSSLNIVVASVDINDIDVVPKKLKCFRYLLGDVYRLCLAPNLKEAMRVFGCSDPSRCHVYSPYPQFVLDLFNAPCVLVSTYDGSTILQFQFK